MLQGFLKDVESGTLRSGAAEGAGMDAARKALETAIECSYWVSTQDRVKQQLVHRGMFSLISPSHARALVHRIRRLVLLTSFCFAPQSLGARRLS